MIKTLAVDFDGVVHAYSRGWDDGTIYDPPLPGALEALANLMHICAVYIHSSRTPHDDIVDWLTTHGVPAVTDYMADHPAFWSDQTKVLVTNRKLPAAAYIDDRAVRFTSWPQTLADLDRYVGDPQ